MTSHILASVRLLALVVGLTCSTAHATTPEPPPPTAPDPVRTLIEKVEDHSPLIESTLPKWMKGQFGGLDYWQWMGIGIAFLAGVGVKLLTGLIVRSSARHTTTQSPLKRVLLRDLAQPFSSLLTVLFWLACAVAMGLRGPFQPILLGLLQIFFFTSSIWLALRLADVMASYLRHSPSGGVVFDEALLRMGTRLTKCFAVLLGTLLCAQNMGLQVFSLLAGLGLGGLAVALAAKDSLANFLGSVMLMLDRPFRVGDWIVVDAKEGIVEEIGFRSTRIRTFQNSLLSMPNSELAIKSIDNMGARTFRRVRTVLNVVYGTPPAQLLNFINAVRQAILAHPSVRPQSVTVAFHDFTPNSLDLLINLHLQVQDSTQEVAERQAIFLSILDLAQQSGIQFIAPAQPLLPHT